MNEIRFNPNVDNGPKFSQPREFHKESNNKPSSKNFLKKLVKFLVALIFIVIILLGIKFGTPLIRGTNSEVRDAYAAVFLTNSQVYFGKIVKNDKDEMVLNKVYYLQVPNQAETTADTLNQRFNLIKLGNELHGPTDELFINKENIIFYEYLREDSKVVESIKNQS